MTLKELSQLYYLNKEIQNLKKRLEKFQSRATATNQPLTGMPHSGKTADKLATTDEIVELKNLLEWYKTKHTIEYNRLFNYIQSVPDSQLRQIMTLRFIDGYSWGKVARLVKGNTADSCRKAVKRFLEKNS